MLENNSISIDEQIETKLKEIQDNHDQIMSDDFKGEFTFGQTVKMVSEKALIEHTILTRTEELLNIELEILLDIKHPDKARDDHDTLLVRAHDLRNEITAMILEIKE